MSIDWRVVPIETWPAGELTEERKEHRFRKTVSRRYGSGTRQISGVDWSATTELLERELRMLDAENIVREARRRTHPDRGNGSKERFQVVETAWAVLSSHHGRDGSD